MTTVTKLGPSDSRETQLHCLLYWEKRQPQKIFMVQPAENGRVFHYTWGDVANQVRRMAAYLGTLNLKPRSKIAIYGKNSAHWIMADLAIWMAGHVSVPLYSTLNAEGAKHVLIHSEAKLLFVGKLDGQSDSWHQVKEIIPSKMPCIRLPLSPEYKGAPQWEDLIRMVSPLDEVTFPDPDALASIVYTSGSTGLPKGVMHSFNTMMSPSWELNTIFKFSPEDRLLSYLPLAHVAERVFVEISALYYGLEVYFVRSRDSFIADIHRAKPTLFLAVPRLWTKFYMDINKRVPLRAQNLIFKIPKINQFVQKQMLIELGLEHVRMAFTASAPMPADIMKWYRDLGLDLIEAYGMTENFGYSHGTRPHEKSSGDVGRPYPGVQCKIEFNGEILVKSPGMMLGYYKDAARTKEAITEDGFLRTGDMGEQDAQGRLTITGRVKDLFKSSKGKYVAPVPIEQKLGNHTMIDAVCVCGAGLPQPIAIVQLADIRPDKLPEAVRNMLEKELQVLLRKTNAQLEPHEKLDFIAVVNEPWTVKNGFLTPTLKIKRNVIEDRYESRLESWSAQNRKVVWM
ncbi:MAG: AMP-binding protein [Aquirhabdus sp.]